MANSRDFVKLIKDKIKTEFGEDLHLPGLLEMAQDVLSEKSEISNQMVQLYLYHELLKLSKGELESLSTYLQPNLPPKAAKIPKNMH